MSNKKDYKGVLVFALVVAIVFMSVGYAALSKRVTTSEVTAITDTSWDIKIINIEYDSINSNVLSNNEAVEGIGTLGAKFNVTLNNPGDKIVYKVTVKNKGTITAKLKEITDLTDTNLLAPADIKFKIDNNNSSDGIIRSNEIQTFLVTAYYDGESNPDAPQISKNATIYLNYVQA